MGTIGCCSSGSAKPAPTEDLQAILQVEPQSWTQAQVLSWLLLTHDGDLSDLHALFKEQKITGVTLVKLTAEQLKTELEIKEFGLRDGFINARNKVLAMHKPAPEPSPNPNPPTQPNIESTPNPQPTNDTAPSAEHAHSAQPDPSPIAPANPINGPQAMTHIQSLPHSAPNMGMAESHYVNNAQMNAVNAVGAGAMNSAMNSAMNTMQHHPHPHPHPLQNLQHQQQRSNHHLVTKPAIRHNRSFDDSGPPQPQTLPQPRGGFMGPVQPQNSYPGPGQAQSVASGAYEEIPDNFSQHSYDNRGVNGGGMIGMQPHRGPVPFGMGAMNMAQPMMGMHDEGPMGDEDGNYADIRYADLNQSDTAMPGVASTSALPFGASMTSLQQQQREQSHAQPHRQQTHAHNQTGSNYDELPLEFIAKTKANAPTSNGYEEIEFADHDPDAAADIDDLPTDERERDSTGNGRAMDTQSSTQNKAPQPMTFTNLNGASQMSPAERETHEFARALWKTLHKIEVKTIEAPEAQNEAIRGFSGRELVRHVKKHVAAAKGLSDAAVIAKCEELVRAQYIRLIAESGNGSKSAKKFESESFLYQFENGKHREFIRDDEPHRRAWTRGTKVQIYSSTLGGWQTGTVVEVSEDTLTITYGPSAQQMRKTLDRYQDDLVKSTDSFLRERGEWKAESKVEVYSHGQHIWCQGRVEEVLENDIFRVFYTNNDDKDFSKYVDRWSPDLRAVQQLSEKLKAYKKGTKVQVWSNSKRMWIPGVVIDVVPTYEVVNVRYGDHEKLVPVSSDDIKLTDIPEDAPMHE